jgi:undecaprenyl-diphosphatase
MEAFMGAVDGIILGIIQGFTEFLPVSSSGHLVIFQEILGVKEAGITFEVMVHFATVLSVIWVFGKDILRLLRKFAGSKRERHFLLMLILGAIPTGLMGLLLGEVFASLFDSSLLTGIMLLLTGAVLFTLSRLKPGRKDEGEVTAADALLIGIAQGIAIIPGISRSGMTITAALWRGMDEDTAVRFSFLLSIPVILGAALLEIRKLNMTGFSGMPAGLLLGMPAAFVSGIIAIRLFVNLLRKSKFHYFAYYCWLAGLFIVLVNILR